MVLKNGGKGMRVGYPKPHTGPRRLPGEFAGMATFFSDMVLQMFGSVAGSESMVISLDQDSHVHCVTAEAPHGKAPLLEGKNVANPMAVILADAGLLTHVGSEVVGKASRAIYESAL